MENAGASVGDAVDEPHAVRHRAPLLCGGGLISLHPVRQPQTSTTALTLSQSLAAHLGSKLQFEPIENWGPISVCAGLKKQVLRERKDRHRIDYGCSPGNLAIAALRARIGSLPVAVGEEPADLLLAHYPGQSAGRARKPTGGTGSHRGT